MNANGRSSTFYEQLQRHIGLAWYPISISIVMFSVFSTFGLAAGQVQEALANYIEDPVAPWSSFAWGRAALTFLTLFIFASSMRYWTARLLSADITGPHLIHTTNNWQKFFIGVAWFAPWVGATLSFTDAALSLMGAQAAPERAFSDDFAFLATSIFRDPFETPFATFALIAMAAPFLFMAFWASPLARHMSWPPGQGVFEFLHRTMLPGLFLGLAALFLFMPPFAIDIARVVGPVPLVSISFAVVTAAGSYLIQFGRTHGLPAFALVAAAPLVLGAFGLDDNHFIRELDSGLVRHNGPTATEALETFQSEAAAEPIIFVSAEGGGIRAAHFTSSVLARLADQCPRVARRIFAISGVSGGAVGAAAYRASLDIMPLEGEHCALDTSTAPGPREQALNAMFARDHLSPTLAKQLFPELLQTFLPASPRNGSSAFAPLTDRQLGLELSLEEAFSEAFGVNRAESPFEASVFGHPGEQPVAPHLLISATEAASGSVFVAGTMNMSHVRRRHRWLHDFRCLWHPPAAPDDFPICDTSPDFRLSTMAAGSARFPIVSPPGALRPGERTFRFVDGGYFDNSGVETILALIDHLQREARENGRRLPPIAILHIDSNPYVLRAPVKWRLDFDIHELQAVLATREERVRISLDRLDTLNQDGRLCSVRFVELANNEVPLRLGWILSDPAARDLQEQAAEQLSIAFPGERPVLCDGDASRALHAANERADERALLIGAPSQ